jgi:methyltransferase (TIGR00027 family)
MESLNFKGEGSRTAKLTAGIRALEAAKPEGERILYDPYAEYFAGEEGKQIVKNFNKAMGESGINRSLIHILRTRYIDDYVCECIKRGVTQVVIFGAGYDSSPYRLPEMQSGVLIFEVDEPDTSSLKQQKVERLFGKLPSQVRYIQVDFVKETLEDLQNKLLAAGYEMTQKTVFTLGGVIPYLTPEAVDNLLHFIVSSSTPGSSVIFTYHYMEYKSESLTDIAAQIASLGEPFRFSLNPLQVEEFLTQRGFTKIYNLNIDQIKEIYRPALTVSLESWYNVVTAEVQTK